MKSQINILPISNPNSSSSSSFSSSTMVFRSEDDMRTSETTSRILIPSSFVDEKKIETRPFLPRSLSYTNSVNSKSYQQQRRRRVASDNSLLSLSDERRHYLRQDVGRMSFNLLKYLGVGYRWIIRFLALGCYAFFLMPGFIQVGYYYFFSKQIRRGIIYGDQPRNRLDLYLPKNSDGPKPIVAFITGGAWIIGYKAWGSLLGQQLSERDIIVACIDYRNFPQGTIGDMVKDASRGISFVCNNIAEYGGDPNRIYLMGQSAGAHIAACALLEQAIKEANGEKTSWSVSQMKSYFGLSGGYSLSLSLSLSPLSYQYTFLFNFMDRYNFYNLIDHFHSRGLFRSIFLSIMEGEEAIRRYSPEVMVQDPNVRNAVSILPPIVLFHGTADYSIPSDSSKSFAETLLSLGVEAKSVLYEGKTHTDLFVQDPMRGGRDDMYEDLVGMIHAGDSEALARDAKARPRRRLVPEFLLKLARTVSPF